MIEIIALVFLCWMNGKLAEKKGLPRKAWWLNTILAWVAAEFIGVASGILLYGKENLYPILAIGLFAGFGGYLLVKFTLEKKPDVNDDKDVDRIGVDDLQPPRSS